jgi:hypothetical protein
VRFKSFAVICFRVRFLGQLLPIGPSQRFWGTPSPIAFLKTKLYRTVLRKFGQTRIVNSQSLASKGVSGSSGRSLCRPVVKEPIQPMTFLAHSARRAEDTNPLPHKG